MRDSDPYRVRAGLASALVAQLRRKVNRSNTRHIARLGSSALVALLPWKVNRSNTRHIARLGRLLWPLLPWRVNQAKKTGCSTTLPALDGRRLPHAKRYRIASPLSLFLA